MESSLGTLLCNTVLTIFRNTHLFPPRKNIANCLVIPPPHSSLFRKAPSCLSQPLSTPLLRDFQYIDTPVAWDQGSKRPWPIFRANWIQIKTRLWRPIFNFCTRSTNDFSYLGIRKLKFLMTSRTVNKCSEISTMLSTMGPWFQFFLQNRNVAVSNTAFQAADILK